MMQNCESVMSLALVADIYTGTATPVGDDWPSRIPGKPRWLVNHGEPEATHVLAARLEQRLGGDAVAVREGQVIEV